MISGQPFYHLTLQEQLNYRNSGPRNSLIIGIISIISRLYIKSDTLGRDHTIGKREKQLSNHGQRTAQLLPKLLKSR